MTRRASRVERIGHYLGIAIGSFVNVFAPRCVVVGGGFGIAAWDLLREPALEAARREALEPADESLRIVQAAVRRRRRAGRRRPRRLRGARRGAVRW